MKPTGTRVLVELETVENMSESGIIIPASAQDKPQFGRVLELGSDSHTFSVKVGELITFGQFAGMKLEHEGKNYLLIKEQDILAVID